MEHPALSCLLQVLAFYFNISVASLADGTMYTWHVMPGSRGQVAGTERLVPGTATGYRVARTDSLVAVTRFWYEVPGPGTRYMVPNERYQVPINCYQVGL